MRGRILCESIESLRREGFRFSLDTLAERLNISKKTIYTHFPTKEALALALYQKYYTEIRAQAARLTEDGSARAHAQLLALYFDAQSMTSRDIFNKFKLNNALAAYTAEQNEALWALVLASVRDGVSEQDKNALRIVVNGSFEKLCQEKIAPEGVIEWLVNQLW